MIVMSKIMPPLVALGLAMLAVNSSDVISKWWHGYGPAVEWLGVEVLSERVRPGGAIDIVYTAIVHRQCPADLRGFIVAEDGSVPVRFPTISGGYARPSEEPVKIRVSIAMPFHSDNGLTPLNSGPHIYRTLATRYCPNGVEYDNAVPDAKFLLEVPGDPL